MSNFVAPKVTEDANTCPHCGTYAAIARRSSNTILGQFIQSPDATHPITVSICQHCKNYIIWNNEDMVYPDRGLAPLPNSDMPSSVPKDYEDAASIYSRSPKGAAALLRLAIQKLCKELGEPGKNINTDIGNPVKNGLPTKIQQSLDVVRVIGNESVHPGQIDTDDAAVVEQLFFS